MRNRALRALVIFGSLVAIAFITAFILCQIPPAGAPPPLPTANGYPALLQATRAIVGPPGNFKDMSHDQLQALVASNSATLQLVRSILDGDVQVPLEYSLNYNSKHDLDLSRFKLIAQAFFAEGLLAQMEQRPPDAARSALDTIRLGVGCSSGGVIIDALVGMGMESAGTSQLESLAANLDLKTCKDAAQELEDIEGRNQSWEQILKQEHYWSYKTFPPIQRMVGKLVMFRSIRASETKTESKFKAHQSDMRKLMIHLAARAYELENGHPPISTTDLVPAYLKAIPLDPFTGEKMTYLP